MYKEVRNSLSIPFIEKEVNPATSVGIIFFTLMKSELGFGIFALPEIAWRVGLATTITFMASMAFISYITMSQLIQCAWKLRVAQNAHLFSAHVPNQLNHWQDLVNARSVLDLNIDYTEIVRQAFGNHVMKIAICAIVTLQYGAGSSCLMLINSLIISEFPINQYLVSTILFVVVGSFLQVRSIANLGWVSVTGTICCWITIATAFIYIPVESVSSQDGEVDYGYLPLFFGVTCFTYSAHAEVVVIEQASKIRHHFPALLSLFFFIYLVLTATFTAIMSMYFGKTIAQNSNDHSLFSAFSETLYIKIMKLGLCASLAAMIPITIFPAQVLVERETIDRYSQKKRTNDLYTTTTTTTTTAIATSSTINDSETETEKKRYNSKKSNIFFPITWLFSPQERNKTLLRILICIIISSIAVTVPKFVQAVAFVGAFFNGLVAFIFPPLCYMKLLNGTLNPLTRKSNSGTGLAGWQMFGSWAIVALGTIGIAFGSVFAVVGDLPSRF